MKKNSLLATACVISISFICSQTNAENRKPPHKNEQSCPVNMNQGDCGEYIEGYLNGKADRGVGEVNVFASGKNSDAYKQGYEKGWKSGRDWD